MSDTSGHYFEVTANGIAIRIAASPEANLDPAPIAALVELVLAGLRQQRQEFPDGIPANTVWIP